MVPRTTDNFKVALLIETSRESGRDFLRGILRFSRHQGHWSIHITPGDIKNQFLPNMKSWGGNGIIARVTSEDVAEAINQANIPTILVGLGDPWRTPESPLFRFSELRSDSVATGKMAAEYFLEQNYLYYAFVGEVEDHNWSRERQVHYVTRLAEAGFACHLYQTPLSEERDWGIEQKRLRKWLRSLPKPIALFTSTDARGRQILDVCQVEHIAVPEDIAVLGVDNDDIMCDSSNPPLSSIAMDTIRGAYQAAELLDQMMKRKKRKKEIIYYGPLHIVSRRSTEVFHVDDPILSDALRHISKFACQGITAKEVVHHVMTSRRSLEIKFKNMLHRSIHDEIQRIKLVQVTSLLLNTRLSISEIAKLSGFKNVPYMKKVFQKDVGKTIQDFRINR